MTGIADITTYIAGVVVIVLLPGLNSSAPVRFPDFSTRPATAALH
jgi:hypothetical protein